MDRRIKSAVVLVDTILSLGWINKCYVPLALTVVWEQSCSGVEEEVWF